MVAIWAIAAPAYALPTLNTTATFAASSLALDGEGSASTHIVKVADLALSTDNETGLSLTVSSGSIDKIVGPDIDFQVVTVANNASAPADGDFTVPSGSNYTYATSGPGSEDRDLYIRYTPASFQDAGNYVGSIHVSVLDN